MIRLQVCKTATKDNFENGCSIESQDFMDFGPIHTLEFSTLEKAVGYARCFGPIEVDGDIIGFSTTENDDGTEPTASEWKSFKRGEIDLWCADYRFYFDRIERSEVSADEIQSALSA